MSKLIVIEKSKLPVDHTELEARTLHEARKEIAEDFAESGEYLILRVSGEFKVKRVEDVKVEFGR